MRRGGDTMDDRYRRDREALLREIEREMAETAVYTGRESLSPRVVEALREVPREEFVPADMRGLAYANHPLSIGHQQTISQPYIVALMTEVLDLEPDHVVLEVGTGSGYQAAVLARLAARVYSVETIPELHHAAAERLARLGYGNVACRLGDGALGWEEHAPFDAIIVTAAANAIPPALVRQLRPGGRMVIPVGASWFGQELLLVTREADGPTRVRSLLGVAFVPLVTAAENLEAR